MNAKKITVFVLMVMVLSANAFSISNGDKQEKKKVTIVGVFDGYDVDDGYSFIVKDDDEDEGDQIIYLQTASAEALKMINLKSKDMEGKRFEVICEVTEYEEKDENGQVEIFEDFHIISIKRL
mgnify:CR=1 FL=1